MGGWNILLFSCSKNCKTFLFTFLPGGICITQCTNAYIAKKGDEKAKKKASTLACLLSTFVPLLGCIINRVQLRESLLIKDPVILDICFWCYCPCCAVTQEYIETIDQHDRGEIGFFVCHFTRRAC
jgi:Cys-rich protein (TIGR01571 family)